MRSQNIAGLELIEGRQIRELAEKAKVTHQYVYLLVTGQRELKSVRAKAIVAAAKALNDSIKKGLLKADEQLEVITDND